MTTADTTVGELTSRNWLGKAGAGLILGYGLAVALSGLFAWFGPEGLHGGPGKVQINMWMIAPPWVLVLGFCFLFRDGWRAWGWLGLANLVAYGLLFGGRWLIA